MENLANDFTHINGWGIDADPENEPTYPMKKYTGDDHRRMNYERPPLQPMTVEKLKSTERPNYSAVMGTSTPPTGLSGNFRRFAFQYSENDWRRWMTLILADRVNMVEGIIDDVKQGHIPNIIQERGWTAEWKYNRENLIKKVAIGAVATIVLFKLFSGGDKKSHRA